MSIRPAIATGRRAGEREPISGSTRREPRERRPGRRKRAVHYTAEAASC
jgi:hypothetical protein